MKLRIHFSSPFRIYFGIKYFLISVFIDPPFVILFITYFTQHPPCVFSYQRFIIIHFFFQIPYILLFIYHYNARPLSAGLIMMLLSLSGFFTAFCSGLLRFGFFVLLQAICSSQALVQTCSLFSSGFWSTCCSPFSLSKNILSIAFVFPTLPKP